MERGFDNQEFAELADICLVKHGPFGNDYRVFVNGVDLSDWVCEVRVEATGERGIVPVVWLAFKANPTIRDAQEGER